MVYVLMIPELLIIWQLQVRSLSEFKQVRQLRKPRKVRLGDDSFVYAYGIGTILLNTGSSIPEPQNTLLYVPDLGCNIEEQS